MTDRSQRLLASCALVAGALLGMAGTFVHSASIRSVLWSIDGTLLIVASALLAIHYLRRGQDLVAAGFVVYFAGQLIVTAGSGMDLASAAPLMGIGALIWAAGLVLVSIPNVMPIWLRAVAVMAAIMFAIFGLQVSYGKPLNALSHPLPFYAFPFLVLTLFGWAWVHFRDGGTE